MLPLFALFGLATLAAAVVLVGSILLGFALCLTKRFRTFGVFLLLVPTLAALGAGGGSWGLAFLVDAYSKQHGQPDWLQVLTIWAWPIGFLGGGLLGGVIGMTTGFVIVKRRRR